MTLCLLIDRITDQPEFDLRDVHISKVVDEIAPGVSESADSRNEGHDTADLELIRMYQPSADQQRGDDLELSAQVHQEVHRELEPKDSLLSSNTRSMRPSSVWSRVVATDRLDDADAELPDNLDARSGAPVHCALHERNEDELGDEERERRARHPKVDMDHVG